MNISGEHLLIMFLFVIAGGTIWNYIVLKISIKNFYKGIKPGATKKDLRDFITILHMLSFDKESLLKSDMFDKISLTIRNFYTATATYTASISEIYNTCKSKEYEDVCEFMDNDIAPMVQTCATLFDEVAETWPEFIERSEVSVDGGKKI